MFHALRKHINATTAVAFLALVFAMTGGAFAVTGHGGNGAQATASKAKPKGKAGPRGPAGKNGAPGATGPAGAAGPAGPAGSAGTKGENGVNGNNGAEGHEGKEGKEGKEGPEGPEGPKGPPGTTGFTRTLPKGETETGTWSSLVESVSTEGTWTVPISFSIPLKIATENFYIVKNCKALETAAQGECETEAKEAEKHCPGTVETPRAEEGALCIYQGYTAVPTPPQRFGPVLAAQPASVAGQGIKTGANTAGAVLGIKYEGPAVTGEQVWTMGTWAVAAS